MENTSGQGAAAAVPAEVDRWNWGAFLLTWIWGIGNNTFIALLALVPFLNLAMPFVLGAHGSAWAWRNRRWESVEAFRATQRRWAQWGLGIALLCLLLFAGIVAAIFATVFVTLRQSEPYRITVEALHASDEAIALLGQPVSTGIPMGNLRNNGPVGEANLSFSAEGPDGEGTIHLQATKRLGRWEIDRAVLEDDASGRRIDLVAPPASDPTGVAP
jgi:hypothetical protein